MNSGNRLVVLGEQDEAVLWHLARYRMTLTRIAHNEFYPERTETKAWGRLHALEKAGYLAKHPLPNRGKYWTLGKKGVAFVGAARDWNAPLQSQAFRKWATTLLFCFDGKKRWERLDAFQMQGLSDQLTIRKQLFESRHYFLIQDDDVDRIGCIRPASDTDPYLVARRCRKDLQLHAEIPAYRQLIRQGRFVLAIVVSNRFQVKTVERAVDHHLRLLSGSSIAFKRKVFLRTGLSCLLPTGKST